MQQEVAQSASLSPFLVFWANLIIRAQGSSSLCHAYKLQNKQIAVFQVFNQVTIFAGIAVAIAKHIHLNAIKSVLHLLNAPAARLFSFLNQSYC